MSWQKTPTDRARDAQVYGAEYRRNAAVCKRRAGGRCERCGKLARLQADHITPVTQGGSHELANLQALCERCHQRKTAGEGGGFRRAQDPAPQPRTKW